MSEILKDEVEVTPLVRYDEVTGDKYETEVVTKFKVVGNHRIPASEWNHWWFEEEVGGLKLEAHSVGEYTDECIVGAQVLYMSSEDAPKELDFDEIERVKGEVTKSLVALGCEVEPKAILMVTYS